MKVFNTIVKIVVALAAVAGAVYVAATYGDKIVAWAKKLLSAAPCNCDCDCDCDGECTCDCTDEPAAEEIVEEAPAEEAADEVAEEAAEEVVTNETEFVADEADFQ